MKQIIQKACDAVGGQTALAKRLSEITGRKITQQRVNTWISRGNGVPVDLMAAIEEATNGAVTRKDLRPDDWQTIWPELTSPCSSSGEYIPDETGRRKERRRKVKDRRNPPKE